MILRNLGFQAVSIHGQMSQVKRLGALNKFKSKEKNILIATDVASRFVSLNIPFKNFNRGLDIPSVDIVINYDLPLNTKDYIHRVGRTARAGKAGRALTLVTQYDVENYLKIEHLINKKLELFKTEEEEVLIFYERVQEAQRIANQEMKELTEKKDNKKFLKDNDGLDDDLHGNFDKSAINKRKREKFKSKKIKKKIKMDM